MNKIKLLLLVLFCCLFSQEVLSQNKLDSLLLNLKTAKEDTSKVKTLNKLSTEYELAGDQDLTRKYAEQALILSEKLHFEKGKAQAYIHLGVMYYNDGNYPETIKNFLLALAIAEKLNDRKLVARCNNNMGLTYSSQGKYSEAVKFYLVALNNYKEINDSSGIALSYNNLGVIYEEQGNHTEAVKSYFAALKIAETRGDQKSSADAYTNIGNVYQIQKNYADAINNYTQAIKLYEEAGINQGIGICYAMLGNVYNELDSLNLAVKFCQLGFEILEANDKTISAAKTKITLANVYLKMGNNKQALENYSVALKLFTEIGDMHFASDSYRGIGQVYFNQGQFDKALENYKKSLKIANDIGYKNNIVGLYYSMAEAYEKKKDYRNAYQNLMDFLIGNDSLLNETKSEQIAEIKTRYESEKKDNDIALLNKDNQIQNVEIKKQKLLKNSFIGGLGLVIVLLLLSYRTYRIRQTLRLQGIRNKIAGDLHDDIGSTLNSISIYSEVARRKDEQQDEALEMIGDASRKIIDSMSDIVWTVNPDNDSFAKIIFRMKSLAYNLFRAKKIEFTFHADEILNDKKLSLDVRRNFYLIFKESINNLVKYSNATRAAIILTSENGYINLSIKDDGVGFDMSDEVIGNGLKNMKRRADEMKAQFRIESSKGNGTQIELRLKG